MDNQHKNECASPSEIFSERIYKIPADFLEVLNSSRLPEFPGVVDSL